MESAEHQGGTFHFTAQLGLPTPKADDAPGPRAKNTRKTDGLKVLVADDDPLTQKLLKRLLEKKGHHPTILEEGPDLRSAAAAERCDLVLLGEDYLTQRGDEVTAALQASRNGDGDRAPILVMTERAPEEQRDAHSIPVDSYLSIPIQPHELYERLRAVSLARGRGQRNRRSA